MLKTFYLLVGAMLLTAGTFAQTVIKGNVSDLEGGSLPGATVIEKGTTNGAVTDLSFETNALAAISSSGNGDFGLQSFRVTGLGPDGASTLNGDFQLLTSGQLEFAAVPEPATMAALGLGLAGIAARRRRNRK